MYSAVASNLASVSWFYFCCLCKISNTRDIGLSKHREESIFDEIRGVWIADETLSRVFDISSQSKQKLRGKSK